MPHNPNTSEYISILHLLAPLVLPIISLYFAHLSPGLLKYPIVHTTEPLLSSGIIYQNLWELSLTRHLILQPLVNVPLYHSHFLRPNFAHISRLTFSASHIHLNSLVFFPARTDHIDLYPKNDLNHTLRAWEYTSVSCFYGCHINFNFTLLLICKWVCLFTL